MVIINSKIQNLFNNDSSDPLYSDIRNETQQWHEPAKKYWQQLFNTFFEFLDKDFLSKFPNEFTNRLWELTIIHFIAQHKQNGIILHKLSGKVSKPDFCFELYGSKFYLEAVCASPADYIELNRSLYELAGKARSVPTVEYMERVCSVIKEKAVTKYYGEKKMDIKIIWKKTVV